MPEEWFIGWVAAACEHQVNLASRTGVHRRRCLAQAAAGRQAVTVEHADLLAFPRSERISLR
jgi:hypothetical protein